MSGSTISLYSSNLKDADNKSKGLVTPTQIQLLEKNTEDIKTLKEDISSVTMSTFSLSNYFDTQINK